MFEWLKRKARDEQLKLLFQNNAASKFLAQSFNTIGDPRWAQKLEEFEDENRRIAYCEQVKDDDLKLLLEINRELRALLDHDEKTGPGARVCEAFGQSPSTRRFDDIFKPTLGWSD